MPQREELPLTPISKVKEETAPDSGAAAGTGTNSSTTAAPDQASKMLCYNSCFLPSEPFSLDIFQNLFFQNPASVRGSHQPDHLSSPSFHR